MGPFEIIGSPATLRATAWKSGTAEPSAWQVSGTDATPTLQSAGSLGFRAYLPPSASGAIVYSFDDLNVWVP